MAPNTGFDTDQIKDKARKDLLYLLEGVSKAIFPSLSCPQGCSIPNSEQVRGKKNLVIEKSLAGPIGLFAKFSTLQDYGVDKVFFLENGNADVSQQNVVFVARGESARQAQSIAGMYVTPSEERFSRFIILTVLRLDKSGFPRSTLCAARPANFILTYKRSYQTATTRESNRT